MEYEFALQINRESTLVVSEGRGGAEGLGDVSIPGEPGKYSAQRGKARIKISAAPRTPAS